MTTPVALERVLVRRVPAVERVCVRTVGPARARVTVEHRAEVAFEDVEGEIRRVLRVEGSPMVSYEVVSGACDANAPSGSTGESVRRYAGFASNQSVPGLKETLVRAVPTLGRAVIEEDAGELRVLVADERGEAPPALLERVSSTLEAVGYAGLSCSVGVLPPGEQRNQLANAGFLLPRRDADIVSLTEEDEETFGARIRRLLDGEHDKVSLVDDHSGSRLLATPTLKPPLPLQCLLPLYDRVFLEMPIGAPNGSDYFEHYFGTKKDDFLIYCSRHRVVPIFKFNLGVYPADVVQTWMSDLALPLITPRTFDYVALRHLWSTSPHLQLLRAEPRASTALGELALSLSAGPDTGDLGALRAVVSWLVQGAEFFEGIAWHRGHLALASLSPGALAGHVASASRHLFQDLGVADTAAIELFETARGISSAQAMDASLSEGLILNEGAVELVLPHFGGTHEIHPPSRTMRLATLIDSLELSYSGRIPAEEYLDVLDSTETKRIRKIAQDMLGTGSDQASTLELRERVSALSAEIMKLERNTVDVADVDVVGDLAGAAAAPYGLKFVAELLSLPTLKRAGAMLAERAIDGTRLGDTLDSVRGTLNHVPAHAVRVYRLRRKLSGRKPGWAG